MFQNSPIERCSRGPLRKCFEYEEDSPCNMQVNYFPKVAVETLDTQREPFAVPVKWVNEKLEKKSETVVAECKEVAACRIIQVPPAPAR